MKPEDGSGLGNGDAEVRLDLNSEGALQQLHGELRVADKWSQLMNDWLIGRA